jgi:hypothetical protein
MHTNGEASLPLGQGFLYHVKRRIGGLKFPATCDISETRTVPVVALELGPPGPQNGDKRLVTR